MGAAIRSDWRDNYGRGSVVQRPSGLLQLLAIQVLFEYGREGSSRPPVTAALLAANTLVFLRPIALAGILPSLSRAAFNPYLILQYGDWTRFFLSPFYHLNEAHLFFNMTSLLWKGIQLEPSMGSVEFATMVASLVGLSQGMTLLLSKCLLQFGEIDSYYHHNAVGFSGVLFGMKVVLNAMSDDFVYLHGMVIPAKYATWAELFLIQSLVPDTSFIGHLGGILAGLVYLWLKRSFSAPNPLTFLISSAAKVVSWPLRFAQRLLRSVRSQGRGRIGRRARETPRGIWRCSTCTYDNTLATDICEMCSTVREDLAFSQRQNHQAGGNRELPVEEVRRRRLERFGR
ncbi:hypothetical protein ACP70R_046086 [Stipagrostis hirtigluma subsp. patula]